MNSLLFNQLRLTGTQINYYFTCHRELWYFSKGMVMEQNSDLVLLGKIIHENFYLRRKKEFMIDETIVIDFIGDSNVINEIKKSNKMEKAHIFQMLYYLYYLKQKGMTNLKGIINYPLLRKKVEVKLTEEKIIELENILKDIKTIIDKEIPPNLERQSHCRACSYYELCYC